MSSSVSATDIISYIGIPLAVLGVLPIIYTCLRTLLTLSHIRRLLHRNHLTAITRATLLTGVVEVEIPRLVITPLPPSNPSYFSLSRTPSGLKGGSWRVFNWQTMLAGHVLYRLQYSDELREPQAEVCFEELVEFLLQRGAVPDVKGVRMLRVAGLWTPAGTSLLLGPGGTESCLRVGVPEEGDGVLSLTVEWQKEWDQMDGDSLQQGWMRVQDFPAVEKEEGGGFDKGKGWEGNGGEGGQETGKKESKDEEGDKFLPASSTSSLRSIAAASTKKPTENTRAETFPTSTSSLRSGPAPPPFSAVPAIRFHLGNRAGAPTINAAIWDPSPSTTSASTLTPGPDITHLLSAPNLTYLPAFAIVHATLCNAPPYTVHIPPSLVTLALTPAIPVGVLVLLDLIPEADAPAIFTTYDPSENSRLQLQKMMARSQKMQVENRLPPAQAAAARMQRESEERNAFHGEFVARSQRDRERAQNRDREGLNSSCLPPHAVAAAALAYLKERKKEGFETCGDAREAIEKMLFVMISDEERCKQVCGIVQRWSAWVERGGMNMEDLRVLRESLGVFCWVSVLMGGVAGVGGREERQVGVDLQEVLGVWKKVRVG
ncbi:hypothetical protein MMC30_004820 [Trapelia coarctata]|nr:hypothetical protein [Trapelia coarctata]